jgi:phosphatidylserine/phosphatidylglycerophosphate/cardiolipin synthase-like enzyme
MRHFRDLPLWVILLALLSLRAPAAEPAAAESPPPSAAAIEVYFSPHGGCTEAIVRELDRAKSSVLVQAYSFTSAPIAKALVEARKRGLKVGVILDASQRTEHYSEADFLANMGVPTRIDAAHKIAHNKIMVIDCSVVITGSFNFTKAAEESNAENVLIVRDARLAEQYTANWRAHAAHAESYKARARQEAAGSQVERGAWTVERNASRPTPDAPRLDEPPPRPPATVAPARANSQTYVASKKSSVFHAAGCRFADRISPQNLQHFATRDDAIAAGKRPCSVCNP